MAQSELHQLAAVVAGARLAEKHAGIARDKADSVYRFATAERERAEDCFRKAAESLIEAQS